MFESTMTKWPAQRKHLKSTKRTEQQDETEIKNKLFGVFVNIFETKKKWNAFTLSTQAI